MSNRLVREGRRLIDGALHLISGKALYKESFEFHPPIAFLATQLWLMLTGNSLAGARVLIVLCACFPGAVNAYTPSFAALQQAPAR